MAGKPKNPDISKTAKRSVGKGKEQSFIAAAASDLNRIISLCNGEWAYVLDLNGRTHHVKTNSEKYLELIQEIGNR